MSKDFEQKIRQFADENPTFHLWAKNSEQECIEIFPLKDEKKRRVKRSSDRFEQKENHKDKSQRKESQINIAEIFESNQQSQTNIANLENEPLPRTSIDQSLETSTEILTETSAQVSKTSKKNKRSPNFSNEEREEIFNVVEKYGTKSWTTNLKNAPLCLQKGR
jgi:tRNA(Met) C34 N-acetyltransferase TmcA